jgi:DNA-binding MarR family transcriptional regulator
MIAGKTTSDDLNFYSLLGVLQSGMWLQSDIEKYLKQYKLSHGRFSILLSLNESPNNGLIGNELAERLGVSKATISKMIERLADERYLICTADQIDLRRKQYSLTTKAKALLRKIIPGYLQRLRLIALNLTDRDKENLLTILSKISFLDPSKTLIKIRGRTITDKSIKIKTLCNSGFKGDIDQVMAYLNEDVDLPTTKIVDFYLGTVTNIDGIRRIEHYLFSGSQMQRNYCTLFFARRNEWRIVNKAYNLGLIDYAQAYSR